MCTYLHGPRDGGTYYFRRGIPARLRGILGAREFFFSLGVKDREAAKRLIPQHTADTQRQLDEAQASFEEASRVSEVAAAPDAGRSMSRTYPASREEFEHEQMGMALAARISADEDYEGEEAQEFEKVLARPPEQLTNEQRYAARLLREERAKTENYRGRYRRRKAADLQRSAARDALFGFEPPTAPEESMRPNGSTAKARTVSDLIEVYKEAKSDKWGQSSRAAIEPPFRVLREMLGDVPVADVDRTRARAVFEIVRALPAGLARHPQLKSLSIAAAVERGKLLGVQPIGPKTVNGSYMAHIAAAFSWAAAEQWIASSPFSKLTVNDPIADQDKRDAFTSDQLSKLFKAAPWDQSQTDDHDKPGRYWIPLIALFTGMRLGEIAGLRVMDADKIDGISAMRVRPYEGRSLKTSESRRDVPVPLPLQRLGLLEYMEHRRRAADGSDLLFSDVRTNVNGKVGAKVGEWFSGRLKELGVVGTKLGMHSFRHAFEDRLRAAGVSGSAEALAVSGRSIAGSQSIYGTARASSGGFPMANLATVLEGVSAVGCDLSHLQRFAVDDE